MKSKKGTLLIVVGPTAVGKTSLAISMAKNYNAEIISADSRQFYKEIPIGTAAPTEEEMQNVKHHFVGNLSVGDYYNVSMYEQDVLAILEQSFKEREIMVMVGGSGLYIDALCSGIDDLPDADESLRSELNSLFLKKGISALQEKLLEVDPVHYEKVDLNNPKRLLRAIEVSIQTGKPYSSQRKGSLLERPFNIIKIGLEMPRVQLNERIERRLSSMLDEGWVNEVRSVFEYRDQNALNTVGYKEFFKYLNNEWSQEMAIEKIKVNTRRYAKRQMTWFKRDKDIEWFSPEEADNIFQFIDNKISMF
jgi:tRNA dimethylallyltransferase